MKKILHISKYYYPFVGGTEQIARNCVLALKNQYEQEVFCFNHSNEFSTGKDDIIDYIDDVRVTRCGCFAKVASQSLSSSYNKLLKEKISEFKPDWIVLHYPNPFATRYLLKYIPFGTKLVVYWHLDIVKQKFIKKFFESQNRRLLKRADRVIATSPNYIDGSPYLQSVKEKCVVIPNCIDEGRLEVNPCVEEISKTIRKKYENKIICLAVGRHVEYKGFEYLIKASKLLGDKYVFLITGKGELTGELKKLARDDHKVHFLGLVSDDELKAYLKTCDIFCFSSITKNEAFGVALAEAMYMGKPSVTFKIPGSGVNYVSLDNVTGLEVENRNVNDYAKAIDILGSNNKLREKYGQSAKMRVIDNFLSSTFNENVLGVFHDGK